MSAGMIGHARPARAATAPARECRSSADASRTSPADRSETPARTSAARWRPRRLSAATASRRTARMSVSSKPRSTACRAPVGRRLVSGPRAIDTRAQFGAEPQIGVAAGARCERVRDRAAGRASAAAGAEPRRRHRRGGSRTDRRARSRAADRPTRCTAPVSPVAKSDPPLCTKRRIDAACASDNAPTFGRISDASGSRRCARYRRREWAGTECARARARA